MDKQEALRRIKALREDINKTAEGWEHNVLYYLDQAADLIEFGERQMMSPGSRTVNDDGWGE